MKYVDSTALKISSRPVDGNDVAAAVRALFGTGSTPAGLTPEQKAKQDEQLEPFFVRGASGPTPSRRSEAAREARLKVLARKKAELESGVR